MEDSENILRIYILYIQFLMINTRIQESSKQFWQTSSCATTFLKGNISYIDEKGKPR